MKVLSLFDGISCGRVALERAGLHVSRYVAYEIEQNAINVSNWNWPDIEHKGSVEGADFTQYRGFDMVIGGSPCQGFSFAGRQLNFNDPRSKLFFEFVRAVKEVQPRYFLLENVRMKKEYENIITSHLGIEPILIDSSLVSAQNRRRLYWTNIPGVDQPEDRRIFLQDILEERVPAKYYHTSSALNYLMRWNKNKRFIQNSDSDKSNCLTAVYSKGVPYNVIAEGIVQRPRGFNKGGFFTDKAPTLTKNSWQHNNHVKIGEAKNKKPIYIKGTEVPPFTFYETRSEKGKFMRRELRKLTGKDTTPRDHESKIYKPAPHQKSNCLVTVDSFLNAVVDGNYLLRKLTPVECERLQTLPDGYTEMVSDTQRYNQLGNGWNVDTIAHIFNHIHLDDLL